MRGPIIHMASLILLVSLLYPSIASGKSVGEELSEGIGRQGMKALAAGQVGQAMRLAVAADFLARRDDAGLMSECGRTIKDLVARMEGEGRDALMAGDYEGAKLIEGRLAAIEESMGGTGWE